MTIRPLPLITGMFSGFALLSLAACVAPSPEPTPAPTPTPVATRAPITPPVAAPAFADWQDAPQTPGDWHYRVAGADTIAEFRSPAGGQIAQLICTADRNVTLAVIARVPGANAITIRTEHSDRALRAQTAETSVSTVINAADPLLAEMAFSKGRFAVQVPGGPQLFLPSWPEVVRVVDDCRG